MPNFSEMCPGLKIIGKASPIDSIHKIKPHMKCLGGPWVLLDYTLSPIKAQDFMRPGNIRDITSPKSSASESIHKGITKNRVNPPIKK